jgi:hypothetical protein
MTIAGGKFSSGGDEALNGKPGWRSWCSHVSALTRSLLLAVL